MISVECSRLAAAISPKMPSGVLVAGLQALEVEHGEAAGLREGGGEGRVDDGVHRRGEDRDREGVLAERQGGLNEIGVGGDGAGDDGDVVESPGTLETLALRCRHPRIPPQSVVAQVTPSGEHSDRGGRMRRVGRIHKDPATGEGSCPGCARGRRLPGCRMGPATVTLLL